MKIVFNLLDPLLPQSLGKPNGFLDHFWRARLSELFCRVWWAGIHYGVIVLTYSICYSLYLE